MSVAPSEARFEKIRILLPALRAPNGALGRAYPGYARAAGFGPHRGYRRNGAGWANDATGRHGAAQRDCRAHLLDEVTGMMLIGETGN